ncbi:MAG: helix-turn-helix transcriptional regulator [Oscillospiraceae bacterium]|jgi:transcriptional regulator with XRE-family HTH domain|nr:helix-turn-helix transcriptional regulator [Oscillospiraceae bacterium]
MTIAIAENVKRLRRQRDMTQDELAAVLGVSAQSVSKWEVGASYPELETIPLIANFFDISVDELLGMANIRDEERINSEMRRMREIFKTMNDKTEADLEALGTSTEQIMEQMREIERNLALEFPHNDEVQIMYATRLLNDNEAEKALEIIERVLARSRDTNLRGNTVQLQMRIYRRLGRHDKADEILAAQPSVWHSREYVTLTSKNLSGASGREDIEFLHSLVARFGAIISAALDTIEFIENMLRLENKEELAARLRVIEKLRELEMFWDPESLKMFDEDDGGADSVRLVRESVERELQSVRARLETL